MLYSLIYLSGRMIFSQPDQNINTNNQNNQNNINNNANNREIDLESTGKTIITDTTENNTENNIENNILILDGYEYTYVPERMREILIDRYV